MDRKIVDRKIESVKVPMRDNMDQVLQRSELDYKSEELQQQAGVFRKHSMKKEVAMKSVPTKGSSGNCFDFVLCCCIDPCVCCLETCWKCCTACASVMGTCYKCSTNIVTQIQQLFTKSILFDNVLADTENAFQTLAKFLILLIDYSMAPNTMYYYCVGVWVEMIRWLISYVVILSSTIVLILPSFFTLLIVRTSTIEKESKAFGGNIYLCCNLIVIT